MANTITNILPKILARGLLALREQAVMPRLVNLDYSNESAQKGDTIDVPIPSSLTVSDTVPSNVLEAPADSAPTKVQISLNNWKKVNFHLTDKQLVDIDKNEHFIPMQMSEAVRALSNQINLTVLQEFKGVYGFVGTSGTTPFGSNVTDATNARKVLNQQLCPRDNRRMVLDFDAEANALALAEFQRVNESGDIGVKREGEIGRKFGFDIFTDDQVVTHTAGGSGTPLVNGALAVGDTSVAIDGMSGTSGFVVGDVVTFAGHAQTYAITVAPTASSGAQTVTVSPAIKAIVADNASVTKKASHTVNLAFHRDAFALAMRPLTSETAGDAYGNNIVSMTDPVTGLSMRLEVYRQYKQVVYELDALWGVKLIRPEYAVRIAG
tara:strand:+ start:9587 stop:10726 length:1140 start_codon:yes stop_codon:yes gene_type:complete